MRILLVGSGGREHALCWKLAQSPKCKKLYCAPGSDGLSNVAEPVDIGAEDIDKLLTFAREKAIDLTVVGPEVPLTKGIVDKFQQEGLKIFGPSKELAALEGSKVFSKELMKRLGVPTADFRVFDKFQDAVAYVESKDVPIVVKADGLCAGKGVYVCKSIEEAKAALKAMMVEKIFGEAADRVIVEDCLVGEEASIIVISDGKNVVPLASSQDHKQIFNGDKGPNTGGMGAYSPAPVITGELLDLIMNIVIRPVVENFAKEGTPYKGALYAGIMVTDKGPYVLEFNVRFGDPETQAILPRLKSDLVEAMMYAVDGKLGGYTMEWDPRPSVCVVIASGGYPGNYARGLEIKGLDEVRKVSDVIVFHAGTKRGRRANNGHNLFITNGGRVLNVTALGNDMPGAIDTCYEAVRKINFDKMHYRIDIAFKALYRQRQKSGV